MWNTCKWDCMHLHGDTHKHMHTQTRTHILSMFALQHACDEFIHENSLCQLTQDVTQLSHNIPHRIGPGIQCLSPPYSRHKHIPDFKEWNAVNETMISDTRWIKLSVAALELQVFCPMPICQNLNQTQKNLSEDRKKTERKRDRHLHS